MAVTLNNGNSGGAQTPPVTQSDGGANICCPKCGSNNIKFERELSSTVGAAQNTVTVVHKGGARHGCLWWCMIGWRYWLFIGWWLRPLSAFFV